MKKIVIILLFILVSFNSNATHQRAGEITFKHINGLTYEFTIITYTFTDSPADRPSLDVVWGDGTSQAVPRTYQALFADKININKYVINHTFPAPANYTISVEDANRNGGVLNIPNSVNIPFFIKTTMMINPFLGVNNSPILQNAPIDNACVNKPFYHNPGAFDIDGDSLSYRLINCKGLNGEDIPGYQIPEFSFALNIDPITGDFFWNTPILQGEYNIAILIEEWRQGVLISAITRDMQISVTACNNNPPFIDLIDDTCIVAGTNFQLIVVATDPDNDNVTLTATGGPISISNNPATFSQPVSGDDTVQSLFLWNTDCSNIKLNPYQMTFKAIDNGSPVKLVFFKTLRIKIISPPPQNLTATPQGSSIILKWNKIICNNAKGYKLYRHDGYSGWQHSYCETGVPAYTGFYEIANLNSINDTTFIDDNNGTGLFNGNEYCYLVIAHYNDLSESYASNEACASLKKDVPMITNVSVNITSQNNGQMLIRWTKPTEHDTIAFPPPYEFKLLKSSSNNSIFSTIYSTNNIEDTTYIENNLNTEITGWKYKIEFYNITSSQNFLIGTSNTGSSIFVSATPKDNKIILSWNEQVPWVNQRYDIFRKNSLNQWDSIGTTTNKQFIDNNLQNGTQYCYYVRSSGKYTLPNYPDNLINFSQQICSTPIDREPPDQPILSGYTDCENNFLSWKMPSDTSYLDVLKYYIYFSNTSGDYILLDSTNNRFDTNYIYSNKNSIAGCFMIVAIDSNYNFSKYSNIRCFDIDECSLYDLPNIFTPNNDGYNDYFVPFPYKFVEKIDIKIFNRYGTVVFQTENPDIKWDGKDRLTNQDCAEGVYFYVCEVYEYRLLGIKQRTLKGSLTILR